MRALILAVGNSGLCLIVLPLRKAYFWNLVGGAYIFAMILFLACANSEAVNTPRALRASRAAISAATLMLPPPPALAPAPAPAPAAPAAAAAVAAVASGGLTAASATTRKAGTGAKEEDEEEEEEEEEEEAGGRLCR
jgi:hypothetical protein